MIVVVATGTFAWHDAFDSVQTLSVTCAHVGGASHIVPCKWHQSAFVCGLCIAVAGLDWIVLLAGRGQHHAEMWLSLAWVHLIRQASQYCDVPMPA